MTTQMHLISHDFELYVPEYRLFTESNANGNRYCNNIGGGIEKKGGILFKIGVMVITTAQLHSSKPKLRFCAGSNPDRNMSKICDDEDL